MSDHPSSRGGRCATKSTESLHVHAWRGGCAVGPEPPGWGGAVSHVYAGDPYRLAVNAGLGALRQSVDSMIVNTIRDEGANRTSNRRHVNESPGVRMPPTGNAKPLPSGGLAGGRVTAPDRPAMPAQPTAGQRSNLPESPSPANDLTVVVPAQSTSGPPTETEPPKYPA